MVPQDIPIKTVERNHPGATRLGATTFYRAHSLDPFAAPNFAFNFFQCWPLWLVSTLTRDCFNYGSEIKPHCLSIGVEIVGPLESITAFLTPPSVSRILAFTAKSHLIPRPRDLNLQKKSRAPTASEAMVRNILGRGRALVKTPLTLLIYNIALQQTIFIPRMTENVAT